MSANRTPSRSCSIAATVASRAECILPPDIDDEQSTMIISRASPPAAAAPAPLAVSVTMASTWPAPSGRYGFWSTSTVNVGPTVGLLMACSSCHGDDHDGDVVAAARLQGRGGQGGGRGHRR